MKDSVVELMFACVVGLVLGLLFGSCGIGMAMGKLYERDGRCRELCRPERYLQTTNAGDECICTTARVKLEKVP